MIYIDDIVCFWPSVGVLVGDEALNHPPEVVMAAIRLAHLHINNPVLAMGVCGGEGPFAGNGPCGYGAWSFAEFQQTARDYVGPLKEERVERAPGVSQRSLRSMYVYVFAAVGEDSPCKIGISEDPERRAKLIGPTMGKKLSVHLRMRVGNSRDRAKTLESACHIALKACRTHGEWFDVPVDVAIRTVRDQRRRLLLAKRSRVRERRQMLLARL
jgi:hypothetical protein